MYDGRLSQGDLELTEKHTLKVGLAIPKSLKQTVPAKSCLGDDNHFLLLNDLSKLKENETDCPWSGVHPAGGRSWRWRRRWVHETAQLQLKRTWQQFTIGGGGNQSWHMTYCCLVQGCSGHVVWGVRPFKKFEKAQWRRTMLNFAVF